MKYWLTLALLSVNAHALEGQVVDSDGEPIKGAKVLPEDSKTFVTTDADGRFTLDEGVSEIHVSAPGYSHRLIHLHEEETENPVITLVSSAIEQVDVIGLPIHTSQIEAAMPVSVLSGQKLRDQQAATLGDTLERQPGVNTNFHGNVASTPVIRGLSGPRVLITQNGLDVSDVSRVGPDHAVTSEVSTVQQIEVLRGPATLFYGSGAIGGVVNVVDGRIPQDSDTRGEFQVSRESVNRQQMGAFNVTTGSDKFALYADGFLRDSEDYRVPVAPEAHEDEHLEEDHVEEHGEEHEDHGGMNKVADSDEQSKGFTLGASYLMDSGYVGFSVGKLNREYGVPGHAHEGEDEHGHEGEEGHSEEERVYADLDQDRYQVIGEFDIEDAWINAIHARAAYTDYVHKEIENGELGTLFSNETSELRVDLFHQEWQHWKGGFNIHYKKSDSFADGDEAFTPSSNTESFALGVMEERHWGNVLFQWGLCAEHVEITAESFEIPELELHGHEEAGEEHAEHEEHEGESGEVIAVSEDYTPVSISVGGVWDYKPGYNLGLSISRSQRAPSAAELLAFGPHIATRTYEVGALFELHQEEGEEPAFELRRGDAAMEESSNIDLTFRKHEGDLGIILNLFYNRFDNFYYQADTGLYAEAGHDQHTEGLEESHEEGTHEDEHAGELPVFVFTPADATFYGLETQWIYKLNNEWKTTLFSDYVRAELDDGSYLPRTPPLRVGADLDFTGELISANLSWMHYATQDKVAELETPTDGYNMVNATLNFHFPIDSGELTFFTKIGNVTDTEARVHTSFIKDEAPRPGRNFVVGLRGSF